MVDSSSDAGYMREMNVVENKKHHISNNKTHLFFVSFAFPAARSLSKAAGVVGRGGAAVWLTAAAVPSPELVNSDVTRSVEGGVIAKATMAALMMRARPAVGLGEGERMRAFLLLNLSKGRRFTVIWDYWIPEHYNRVV